MTAFSRVAGDVLDHYLAQGYYRMHQEIFTCRFLPRDESMHTVHWLRLALPRVQYGAKQRHLLRRNDARFQVEVKPLRLSDEHEELYLRYYLDAISFDTAPSLEYLLLDGATHTVFDSWVIEVRDAGQLVAGGIFDRGTRTMAGIVNFYDPAYRKFSLGKYLLLRKVEFGRQQHLAYYYPGYLVHNFPKFDYKLFADEAATEVYDCLAGEWYPFSWEEVNRESAALWRALLDK